MNVKRFKRLFSTKLSRLPVLSQSAVSRGLEAKANGETVLKWTSNLVKEHSAKILISGGKQPPSLDLYSFKNRYFPYSTTYYFNEHSTKICIF